MKNKLLISFSVLAITLILIGFLLEKHARKVVLNEGNLDSGATASFSSLNLSSSHVIYFTYSINDDSEISRAYWRLIPFGVVEVEK